MNSHAIETRLPDARRARLIQQLITEQLDIHDVWASGDFAALCELESETWTIRYRQEQDRHRRAVEHLQATLSPEQEAIFREIDDVRLDLNTLEQRTAFALGRDFSAAAASRRPALERFMSAAQAARRLPAHGHDEDHDMLRASLEEVRRALPVARQILLTSRPLDCVNNPLEAYVAERTKDDAETQPGEEREAVYHVALVLGLLLAEVL